LKRGFVFSVLALVLSLPCFGASFYVGSDSACFYPFGGSPCAPVSSETSIGLDLSGNPILFYTPDASFSAAETGGDVELGNFYVTPALLGAEGGNFTLDISFTDPANGNQTFSATTLGLVVFSLLGAEVTFDQPLTQAFNYPDGSFDVTLPRQVLIGAGDTMPLDATITTLTVTPEPASMPAILGGLMLFAVIVHSRMANRKRVQ
jgi:hypothetical protein